MESLEQMEKLEKKYNVSLYVILCADPLIKDAYFEIKKDGQKVYLGSTLEEVENNLLLTK